jgi:hypothetical protein
MPGPTRMEERRLGDDSGWVDELGSPVLVMVSRCGRGWLAEVAALGTVRRRRSLAALDRCVRELLGTGSVEYHFATGDARLDRLVVQIQTTRHATRRNEERVQRLVEQALRLPCGGSVRDLAVLLGLSHQRVQQLLSTMEGECDVRA